MERQKSGENQKKKIRQRYQGIDPDLLEVIPAKPRIDIFQPQSEQRVAVYARVSTDDPRQTSSYELQKNYYEDMVDRNPLWKLVGIYNDLFVAYKRVSLIYLKCKMMGLSFHETREYRYQDNSR